MAIENYNYDQTSSKQNSEDILKGKVLKGYRNSQR
jgi:hypothetical protein